MGDFNAHIDKSVVRFPYHDDFNNNGKLMKDFIQETDLLVANGRYQKKKGKLWTFISDMSGTKTQIDYILVNKKWKNSIHNCESYNSFSSVGSDHRIVTAKVKMSLRKCVTPPDKDNYNWSSLRDSDLIKLYTIRIKNRFESLCNSNETISETYNNLINANKETAKELIPSKQKSKKKRIAKDMRVVEARQKVEEASIVYFREPSDENRESMQQHKDGLRQIYDEIQEEELDKLLAKVESANEEAKHKESWRLINEITGPKTIKTSLIKAKDKDERKEKWLEHFRDLLGKEPNVNTDEEFKISQVFENLDISDNPFSMEEYETAKKMLKGGKASGTDGIAGEVLKYCEIDDILLQFINRLFLSEKPDQWSESNLKPLPKSGDLSITSNYRGIALSSIPAKVANRMILNRIRPVVDPLLRPNQNGFRPGRSTVAHILALRRLIEGVKEFNLAAVLVFVDFKKAFDSIHRGRMFKILKAYGIPEKLVKIIELMYSDTRARVLTPDGETEFFNIVAGVLQGDTLAPFLFAIVLDYVMRQALNDRVEDLGFYLDRKRSRRHQPIIITDTDFADDIALISKEIEQAQEMLTRVEHEASKVGLHLNAKKTELMKFNLPGSAGVHASDGSLIKETENFKYLGGWLGSSKKDFEIRKALAWSACNKLTLIWKSNVSRKIKERLFVATVESILLYGAETWTIDKTFRKRLDGCYTRMLRVAFNVSWKDKIKNVELYGGLPAVSSKVTCRRLKIAGHCIRHSDEEVAGNLVLWQPVQGNRKRGRRAANYVDTLLQDTDLCSIDELRTAMLDRASWRKNAQIMRADARPM